MGRLIKSRFNGRKNHGKIDKPAGFAIIDVSIVDRSIISEEELNGTYFSYAAIQAFHAQRSYLRPCLGEIGLVVGQPKLITYLACHGPCGQRELAEYFEVDSAAVSRMVDSLEKGGFITRRPNEENRRCNSIELTEKGHRADETWRERCREMEELMLDGFSAEERERFAGYLSRAYRNLRGQKEGVL